MIAASLAATALTFTVAAYQAEATESSASGDSHRSDRAANASAPCLADATTLIGDLDGDSYPDKIINPGHTGTKMTIQWGNKNGSFGEKVSVKSLLGAKSGEVAAAAVADFENDGKLDMVVNIVKPADGDDPATARVAEYRPGPLDRTHLRSAHSRHFDIGDHGEAKQLAVARYNDDAYPDLAVLNNAGDGVMERDVRLSKSGGGLANFDYTAFQKYGETGTWGEPPAMPTNGWKRFYTSCS